jgi:37-kD nucleoid-associated bacterial protein
LFVRPFKNLLGHRFSHHSSLEKHEMNNCAKAIFASEDALLAKGCEIAKRLYSKSNHPNIKSGDLCVSLIHNIEVNDEPTRGICILKSESVVPFLSISTRNGDLQLSTEQGINPEKIDKGCLILDCFAAQGYHVLTFDRTGTESRFWVRDFLGVQAVADDAFLTNTYASMAVSFLENEAPADDSPPWETSPTTRDALDYFEGNDKFDLQEFEQQVLKTPDVVAKFTERRAKVEQEQGQPLEKSFAISKRDVSKAKKKIGAVLKLDHCVEIHLKSDFLIKPNPTIERGFDEDKGMKFIKVYYHKETEAP